MKLKPIYVETKMSTSLEKLWEFTQVPEIHQEWDLRFNHIRYLPKEDENAPQRFLYETQIGFGFKVSGEGESTGNHSKETGESTSALKFWSDESISLIRAGSGYWKYIPNGTQVTFLTWYDYKTRHGLPGKIIDKFFFRPLIGWATAWSFDALKIWLERGIPARLSKKLFLIQILSNLAIGITWIYHGLIPKILFMETGELEMIRKAEVFRGFEESLLYLTGTAEILFGLIFFLAGGRKFPHYFNIFALGLLATSALIIDKSVFLNPFNPFTTSLGVIALSLVVLSVRPFVPNAGNCKRKPEKN